MSNNIRFLGVSSGICAPTARGRIGAELGFDAIRAHALKVGSMLFIENSVSVISADRLYTYLRDEKHKDIFKKDIKPVEEGKELTRFARHIGYLKEVYPEIRDSVEKTLKEGALPFVIAGDHSTAAATIAGIKKYLQNTPSKKGKQERLGVIWIDAHMDAHSPYSTPSGNMHGMPIGVALKLDKDLSPGSKQRKLPKDVVKDWNSLCLIHEPADKKSSMINENELVYIGIRSWEPHENTLILKGKKNKIEERIKHFKLTRKNETEEGGAPLLEEVEEWNKFNGELDKFHLRNKTLLQVCKETIAHLRKNGCTKVYVSFDIDSIEGRIVPGTGTPEPYGLGVDEAQYLLHYFLKNKEVPLIGMELVEVNPLLDHGNKTAKVAFEIIKSLAE